MSLPYFMTLSALSFVLGVLLGAATVLVTLFWKLS